MPDTADDTAPTPKSAKAFAVWGWVPQIFYDLIARIIPGAALLVVFPITWLGPREYLSAISKWLAMPAKDFPSLSVFLIILPFMSYAISTICLGIWFLVLWAASKSIKHVTINFESLIETGIVTSNDRLPILYEEVKQADPAAGNRITKLKAELHMSAVLSVGIVMAFVACSAQPGLDQRFTVMSLLAPLFIGALGAQWHFARRAEAVARNRHALLQKQKQKPRTRKRRPRKKS